MFRSPPLVRASTKAQRPPLSAASDKKSKVQRSLSSSSEPSAETTTATTTTPATTTTSGMAGDKDKKSAVDPTIVAACVNNYLAGEDVFEKLVTRLTSHMTTAIDQAVRSAMGAVNEQLGNLWKALKEMEERLADRVDELEQYQRRNNIRIFGVEETEGEDTDALVMDLCREKLGVQLPDRALCRSHRVGKQPKKTSADGRQLHRPIIVRFVSYQDRRSVYGAKKRLKGTGVLIREDLTKRRVEVWKAAVAAHGLRSTWTQDGRVLWQEQGGRRGAATTLRDV